MSAQDKSGARTEFLNSAHGPIFSFFFVRAPFIFGFFALALTIVFFAACGYRLRGTGNLSDVLPPTVKKIGVPLFINQTTKFELDKKLTQAVFDEFVARGRVEITSDTKTADAVLTGTITGFSAVPAGFSSQGSADHYTVYVVASITLVDSKTQKVIYSNPSYTFNEDYEVPQGKDFESVENEAIKKIAPKFARNLVLAILEGF
jgi:outer membrane lipopolysaccharide assembly protein LptE/RlpB